MFIRRKQAGFSLVELVIVVVILGVIAAVAIPRLSRGARTAGQNTLKASLAEMRSAIELFAAEHEGKYPDADIANQLTMFTDIAGDNPSATASGTSIYGPYLKEIPIIPVGTRKGKNGIFTTDQTTIPGGLATDGWWYNTDTHEIKANLPDADTDIDGVKYNTY